MHFHMFAHVAKRTANYVFLPRTTNKEINHMLHHVNGVFACMIIVIVIVMATMIVIVMATMIVDILMFVVAMAVHLTLS